MIQSGRSLLGTHEALFFAARLFDFDPILNLSKRVGQIGGMRRGDHCEHALQLRTYN